MVDVIAIPFTSASPFTSAAASAAGGCDAATGREERDMRAGNPFGPPTFVPILVPSILDESK